MATKYTIQAIALATCEIFNIDLTQLKGKAKNPYFVDARRVFATIAKEYGYTTLKTGEYLGKDHSTIVYYLKKQEDLITYDADLRKKQDGTRTKLRSYFRSTKEVMTKVDFEPAPNLWPEQYTDHFVVCNRATGESVNAAIKEALIAADIPTYDRQGTHVFTSNQLLVDELKDALYGAEIPFIHTHIPEHYG